MKLVPKIGDWVRFYSCGHLVIGEVRYIREKTISTEACTDQGTVDFDSILEIRSRKEGGDV